MILPGQMIRARGIFTPFCERQVYQGLSYGVSCAGYDVRLRKEVKLIQGHTIVGVSLEHMNFPPDLLGMVADKSTWARQGVLVGNTIIEPGWSGYLAIELTYQPVLKEPPRAGERLDLHQTLTIKEGTPIAQILIHQLTQPAEKPYQGKYQNATFDDVHAKLE